MRKLTPAQVAQREERAKRMSEDVPTAAAVGTDENIEEAPLNLWLDQDETFTLGGKTYQLVEFPFQKLNEGYALVYACPAILLALALAGKDRESVPLSSVTICFNALTGRSIDNIEKPPLSDSSVHSILQGLPEILQSEKIVDTMIDAVLFALRRKHPDLTREEIASADDFDKSFFVRFLRAVFRVNTGMKDSF